MILADLGKFVGGKVATAVIFLAVGAAGYWCYKNPESLKAGAHVVKVAVVWIVLAAALPWSSALFVRPLLAKQSEIGSVGAANALGISVIALYTLLDILLAFWLASWTITGSLTWMVLILGFAAAAAYNFVICESLARQADA